MNGNMFYEESLLEAAEAFMAAIRPESSRLLQTAFPAHFTFTP